MNKVNTQQKRHISQSVESENMFEVDVSTIIMKQKSAKFNLAYERWANTSFYRAAIVMVSRW